MLHEDTTDTKLKTGDWCFCKFELHQITETIDDRITGVTDGTFSIYGRDLRDECFPMSLAVKRTSDYVRWWGDELIRKGNHRMNYADIHKVMVSKWVELCEVALRNDTEELKRLYRSFDDYMKGITQTNHRHLLSKNKKENDKDPKNRRDVH